MPELPGRRLDTLPRRGVLVVLALLTVVVGVTVTLIAVLAGGGDEPTTPASTVVTQSDPVPGGQRYEVSPAGDDSAAGTADAPWRTLGFALAQLGPGDLLTVGGGRYDESVDLDLRRGREDSPVRVVAAEGARPVLHGLLWLTDLSWWDIRGLNVTWDDDNGPSQQMVKLVDGTGWRFADAELWGARSYAALLVAGNPVDFTLSGLYVHDTYPSNGDNQDHLIYLNCGTGGGVVERSLLVGSHNGRAIKVGGANQGDDEVGNIDIRYVTMVDNRGPSNVQLAWDVSDVTITHSILVGSGKGRSSVTAFELHGTGNVVRNNVSWDSAAVLDDDEGLTDGGGNLRFDPRLRGVGADQPYSPRDSRAADYGRWAPAER